MTGDLRERLEASLGEGPAHPPVVERLASGRRALRRRRRRITFGTAALAAALVTASALARPYAGAGGGGIDNPTPPPAPTQTAAPTPVHLLVAPPRYIRPGTPPVLYLYGRMFKRAKDVTVLATYGEIDESAGHPQGAAIVEVGGHMSWVAVVGNEPRSLSLERPGNYNYPLFIGWAQVEFPILSGRLALAATAPGPFAPVSNAQSPVEFLRDRLVAKPGARIVERDLAPVANAQAVPPCQNQAVRVQTSSGDWFVLAFDCGIAWALYSERVGVRADTLSSWLVQVKRVQDAYVS